MWLLPGLERMGREEKEQEKGRRRKTQNRKELYLTDADRCCGKTWHFSKRGEQKTQRGRTEVQASSHVRAEPMENRECVMEDRGFNG